MAHKKVGKEEYRFTFGEDHTFLFRSDGRDVNRKARERTLINFVMKVFRTAWEDLICNVQTFGPLLTQIKVEIVKLNAITVESYKIFADTRLVSSLP